MIEPDKIKILVVDDDPDILSVTIKILRKEGYDVDGSDSCGKCLERIRSFQPDIILLDVILPDCNGVELASRIKKESDPPPIIILLSGIETSSDRQSEGLESGADGYIARPVENRELIARVNAYSRLRRNENRLQFLMSRLESLIGEKNVELKKNMKLSVQREFRIKELRDEIEKIRNGMTENSS